jgi:hypothetical protein
MSARALVARVRGMLAGTVVLTAALWGVAIGLLGARLAGAVGVACGILTAAGVLWRGRHVWSIQRVALWLEEQVPSLQYALVTAVDPRYADAAAAATVRVTVRPVHRWAIVRSIVPPLVVLALAAALPKTHLHTGAAASGEMTSRLTSLHVLVTPPAYAHMPTRTMLDPTTIPALVGSRIAVNGQHGWDTTFTMPAAPAVERLIDRQFTRVIVLQPIADAPPTVVLTTPVRDSVIKEPASGTLRLTADASDDIGLADGYFEYLITSGEEDAGGVKGREGRTGHLAFRDAKTGPMGATLRLDSLGLGGGDLLSVRAVVFDGNAGKGISETRAIRVMTAHAYDSLALEAAPPPDVDTADKVDVGRRLYLRGAPPAIVVEGGPVRLRGDETPHVSPRTPGPALPTQWARFAAAVELLRTSRSGVDSLAVLRVDATNPALDSALDDALAALHAGTNATPALRRARQAIIGRPTATGTLSAWSRP